MGEDGGQNRWIWWYPGSSQPQSSGQWDFPTEVLVPHSWNARDFVALLGWRRQAGSPRSSRGPPLSPPSVGGVRPLSVLSQEGHSVLLTHGSHPIEGPGRAPIRSRVRAQMSVPRVTHRTCWDERERKERNRLGYPSRKAGSWR